MSAELDVEALATALERTYHGSHPSSARRDDWVSDASFVADEYAAIILARLSSSVVTVNDDGTADVAEAS